MVILITGGCGFVGLNVIRRLIAEGVEEIRIVDNLSNASIAHLIAVLDGCGTESARAAGENRWTVMNGNRRTGVSLTVADIRDAAAADRSSAGCDAVIHLAAQTGVQISLAQPEGDLTQNVVGSFNFLEACRRHGVRRFVVASSMAAAGDSAPPQREDDAIRPISPYGAGKAALEAYCSAYYRSFGIETVPLRFANLYGPYSWRKGSVVATFCKRGMAGQPLFVEGGGTQTRDLVFAEDLARVVHAAVTVDSARADGLFGRPLNLATGLQTTIAELAARIRACLAAQGFPCEIAAAPGRQGDVRVSAPDISRLAKIFPEIEMRGISAGLPETVAWFARHWRPATEGAVT